MNRILRFTLLLTSALAAVATAKEAPTEAETAVLAVADAYVAAFNAGQASKLADLYADDAEWLDQDGNLYSGKPAILKALGESFAANKGRTIELSVESVRKLGNDVLLDKGSAVVTGPDGTRSRSDYTTVYQRSQDRWVIAQITETGDPTGDDPGENLAPLDWLIGKWTAKKGDELWAIEVARVQNGNFLTINYRLGDGASSTEIVGFDPAAGKIRSWTFDSEGGFSEAVWRADGNRWLLLSKSVNPDGTRSSSQMELHAEDDHRGFSVEIYNRESGGEPLPKLGPITFKPAS